jgi:hypothetical protein
MTISNKYHAGLCVLTITLVGYARVNWITKIMAENLLLDNFKELISAIDLKSNSLCANGPFRCSLKLGDKNGQGSRIESGANQV